MQLTKVKMELQRVGKLKEKVELELRGVGEREEQLQKILREQRSLDIGRLRYELHEEKMRVVGARRRQEGAEAENRSLWEVNTSNGELHEADRTRWAAEMKIMEVKLREAQTIAEQEAELYVGVKSSGATAEASAGTTRKAVVRPVATGLPPKQLSYAAETEAETAKKKLAEIWDERDAIEDKLWAAEDELGAMQQFMGEVYPGSHAAWLARQEGKKKKKKKSSSSSVAG